MGLNQGCTIPQSFIGWERHFPTMYNQFLLPFSYPSVLDTLLDCTIITYSLAHPHKSTSKLIVFILKADYFEHNPKQQHSQHDHRIFIIFKHLATFTAIIGLRLGNTALY